MPTISKPLYRGAAATSSATLYTVPASTTTVVTNILVTNTAGTAANATISLGGVVMLPAVSVAANSVAAFDLTQTMTTGVIAGFASATTVNFHISGVEIS